MVTTFIGSGAMIACATMSPTEIAAAHGPYDSIVARSFSTFPASGPMISKVVSAIVMMTLT
jgi:hypothetical protein